MHKRIRVLIKGVVQGVGFRPFVFKLAKEQGVCGYVLNNSSGVLIDAEGDERKLEFFFEVIKTTPPKNAVIESVEIECDCEPLHRKVFEIRESDEESIRCAMLPTDKAICLECQKELRDKNNRRFEYPFINCIECGPRYTIIENLPYDRAKTSMESFTMCPVCKEEYENPLDRRFHAQPNSCAKCGPELTLYRKNASVVVEGKKAIDVAAKAIKKGEIVAIKGMGGFHLVCDASKVNVVMRLREKKKRPAKPFAVMFAAFSDILKCSQITEMENELINAPERPIVLVKKRKPHRLDKFNIACDQIAPNNLKMGVFLPYTPIHMLLMDKVATPIVCTSANVSDEAIITSKEAVFEKLSDVVDYVLDYNREIVNPCDDSVVDICGDKAFMIRRARGYAPANIKINRKSDKKILALGASQKNSIAIAFEGNILVSPHIGDIDNLDTFDYFKRTVELFSSVYDFTPDVVVHDRHPDYASTKYAKSLGVDSLAVYHHHAHILALMAEHNILDREILGIAWDGSGYGEDGTIWGGEFLKVRGAAFERAGYFKPFKLLGGESAIREPKRIAFSILFDLYGEALFTMELPFLKAFEEDELATLRSMHEKSLNTVMTSSAGRLFDAVASILGVLHKSTYEGEAGAAIEMLADKSCAESYAFEVRDGVVDWGEMFRQIVAGRQDVAKVSARFINTLAKTVTYFAKETGLPVGLSGGVFQNGLLLEAVKKEQANHGFTLYTHTKLPPNDGCIAFGQAVYATLKH